MAFDLMVGKGSKVKDSPDIVGSIEFDELPSLSRLIKRLDSGFLHRVSNLFEDQVFSVADVTGALDELLPLLTQSLEADERAMLHKLIAVLAFAQARRQNLHGIAD